MWSWCLTTTVRQQLPKLPTRENLNSTKTRACQSAPLPDPVYNHPRKLSRSQFRPPPLTARHVLPTSRPRRQSRCPPARCCFPCGAHAQLCRRRCQRGPAPHCGLWPRRHLRHCSGTFLITGKYLGDACGNQLACPIRVCYAETGGSGAWKRANLRCVN